MVAVYALIAAFSWVIPPNSSVTVLGVAGKLLTVSVVRPGN
jgi:hypothetical protein